MSVTFATKTWGGDYKKFLGGAFERKINSINYPFDEKILVVNNGVPEEVYFKQSYVNAPALQKEILRFFDLTEEDFEGGINYALGELAGIWLCNGIYGCWVQGDVLTTGGDWVTPSITVLENEPDVLLVSPFSEVNTWHDKDGYDQECSDQAFVFRVSDLRRADIYQIPGRDENYPLYGGNSFEHMIGNYLKATGKKRKILKSFYVLHPTY